MLPTCLTYTDRLGRAKRRRYLEIESRGVARKSERDCLGLDRQKRVFPTEFFSCFLELDHQTRAFATELFVPEFRCGLSYVLGLDHPKCVFPTALFAPPSRNQVRSQRFHFNLAFWQRACQPLKTKRTNWRKVTYYSGDWDPGMIWNPSFLERSDFGEAP